MPCFGEIRSPLLCPLSYGGTHAIILENFLQFCEISVGNLTADQSDFLSLILWCLALPADCPYNQDESYLERN